MARWWNRYTQQTQNLPPTGLACSSPARATREEKSHIETLLRLLEEVESGRPLNPSEQFVQMILKEALDKIDSAW